MYPCRCPPWAPWEHDCLPSGPLNASWTWRQGLPSLLIEDGTPTGRSLFSSEGAHLSGSHYILRRLPRGVIGLFISTLGLPPAHKNHGSEVIGRTQVIQRTRERSQHYDFVHDEFIYIWVGLESNFLFGGDICYRIGRDLNWYSQGAGGLFVSRLLKDTHFCFTSPDCGLRSFYWT